MTRQEATEFVRAHSDQDAIDDDDCEAAYIALYGRKPDAQDRAEGIWSHCCAAL